MIESSLKYVDIHTHNLASVDQEIISVHILDSRDLSTSLEKYPQYFCWGTHPWQADTFDASPTTLKNAINNPHFFGLGEIGLDKKCSISMDLQLACFKYQIQLAIQFKIKLIVLHCVKTYNECYTELISQGYNGKVLLHGFIPNLAIFEQYNKKFETYVSINYASLSIESHLKNLQKIPLSHQFLETDDGPNKHIIDVYQKYGEKFNYTQEFLKKTFIDNFQKLTFS